MSVLSKLLSLLFSLVALGVIAVIIVATSAMFITIKFVLVGVLVVGFLVYMIKDYFFPAETDSKT